MVMNQYIAKYFVPTTLSRSDRSEIGYRIRSQAGLQVSCLTGEVQKLVESNEELKKDQILQR